ncbi:MAG: tetratricopeptide repeat protein [Cytophagales bacterium]|nr:tetratricopeptide repeat protein [Cytophagales bacterium]
MIPKLNLSFVCILSFSCIINAQTIIDRKYDQKYIDQLELELTHANPRDRTDLLNALSEAYWFKNPEKTIEYAKEALKLSREHDDKKNQGYALINLCQGYLLRDIYDQALEYGLKSLEIREALGDKNDIVFTLRTIGWLYYDINNSEMALHYHKKVLEYHLEMDDPHRIAYSYNSLGLVYAQMQQHHTALEYYKKSLLIKDSHNLYSRRSETIVNMGISYLELGAYKQALEYSKQALELNSTEEADHGNMANSLNLMASVYLKLGDYENSEYYLNLATERIAALTDNQELTMENNLIASNLYHGKGDFRKSMYYYMRYIEIKNNIQSLEKNNKLAEMRITYENEKKENEIKLLERENEIADVKRKALTGVLILLFIIAVLIISRLKSSQRKRRIIYEAQKKLSEIKLQNERLEQEKLKDQLQFKSQELVNFSLHISQKNEMYKDFICQLQEIEFMNKIDASRKIQKLIRDFNQNLKFNETLEEYESDLDQIEEEFFYKIHRQFPNLTNNDRRLMAQLRMKLSSKEISTLNNISVKSVEISRYRLRKKLNLKNGESLTAFVQKI